MSVGSLSVSDFFFAILQLSVGFSVREVCSFIAHRQEAVSGAPRGSGFCAASCDRCPGKQPATAADGQTSGDGLGIFLERFCGFPGCLLYGDLLCLSCELIFKYFISSSTDGVM